MRTPDRKQLQAISHISGPALVLAGPGSGKTFTIIERIQHLIRYGGVPSGQILVVTFSKAAALEMQQRYQQKASCDEQAAPVHFGTFHSLGFHILNDSSALHKLSLISESEKYHLLEILLKNRGLGRLCTWEKEKQLLDSFSAYKNESGKEPDPEAYDLDQAQLWEIYDAYQEFLSEQNKIDFDDMILRCLQLFKERPAVLKKYQTMFPYILADEFQDINRPQYELLRQLALPRNNLFVVGDDDQAIYGFRGSQPEIMKQFLKDYPDAQQYMLYANYRSGEQIVRLGGEIIRRNQNRFTKSFEPKRAGGQITFVHAESRKEEEQMLLRHLRQFSGQDYTKAAIIVRTNREVRFYKELCLSGGIPVCRLQKDNAQIYDSIVARDIEAFLRFVYEGHQRKDFLQFMNKPNRYLSRSALHREIVRKEEVLAYYSRNAEQTKRLGLLFDQLALAERLSAQLAIRLFRKGLAYDAYLKEAGGTDAEYHHMLQIADRIEEAFGEYRKGTSLQGFWEECRKKEPEQTASKQIPGVHILTMHTSKGLEFDQVYLPDLNEGMIPPKGLSGEAELEEERRLLYVAVTRARDHVFLYETKERNREITRFLKGIQLPTISSNS